MGVFCILCRRWATTTYMVLNYRKAAQRAAQIPNIHLKIGELQANDFEPQSIDAVTMFHVVEHLPNPAEVLAIISQIIKPGGGGYHFVPQHRQLAKPLF